MGIEPENFPKESGRTATQRGSLKQVNATLLAQTDVLKDTQKSIFATQNLLSKSLQGQLKTASMTKLKDLEKQREGGRFKAAAGGISAAVSSGAQKGLGSIQGMLRNIGSFLTPAALMALPGILGGVLLKRGIPALAVGIFSDEIADFLLGPEADKEMRDQVSNAIKFGAAGSLLGKRFALIGAAAGFLIDDEVAGQLTELGKSFGNMLGMDIKNLDDLKGVMMSIGEFLRGSLKGGLEGINQLLSGDIKGFLGIGEEGGGNLLATLGTLAGLGLVFAPGTTLKFGFGLGKLGLKAGILAVTGIWKLVPAALGALGLLGQTVGSAGKGAGVKGALGKAGGALLTLGRFGTMFAMGPAGAIVLAAGAGFAFTEWFKSTELGKDLMRRGEEASAELNKDVLGQEGRELAETTVSDADLGIVETKPFIQTEQDNALRQTYIRAMERSEPGSSTYELNKKALERLEAKMVDPGLRKALADQPPSPPSQPVVTAPPPSSGMSIRNESAASQKNNTPIVNAPSISDNSTTVNAPTNNAVSIPATSSGQYDRYEAWLDERGSTPAFAR